MMKIIAVGNRLMKDDGISIAVANYLKDKLNGFNFEIIIGETDYQTCFYSIGDTDFVVIIDAILTGNEPGSIHIYNLQDELTENTCLCAQHDSSLIDIMKLNRKSFTGCIIGIEAAEVSFGNELSTSLKERFADICFQVQNTIQLKSAKTV